MIWKNFSFIKKQYPQFPHPVLLLRFDADPDPCDHFDADPESNFLF
jgi:hypothetical protein